MLALSCAAFSMAPSGPRQRFSIDFNQGQRVLPQGSHSIVDPQSNMTFRATVDKGTKAKDRPQIVSQDCHTPPGCLRISLDPSAKGAAKNKIMYSFWSHYKPLLGGEQGRMRIGDNSVTRVSFAMKLGQNYDTPLHQMIHFQIYQPEIANKKYKPGAIQPGGPILSLRTVPVSRRKNKSPQTQEFIIVARSPDAAKLHFYDKRDKAVLYRGTILKNRWYVFSFQIQSFRRGGKMEGNVGFWLNDRKVFERSAPLGFDPADNAVSPNLGFELGSYRSADQRGHQTVYLDDVDFRRSSRP